MFPTSSAVTTKPVLCAHQSQQDPNRSLSSPGILSKAGRYFQNRVRLVIHVLRTRSYKPQTIPESPSQPLEPRVETSPLPRDPAHSSNPIVFTSTMSGSQIIEVLRECRVPDVTNKLKGSENSPISFGSSGYLYHARNAEEEVAVRTIRLFLAFNNKNRRLLESAAHELLVWQRLQHQNILPLIGVACFQGQVALVSPWMGHGSIEDFQRKEPLFDRMKMCTQVARAVAYLHENDVVHGDIKAQNVLVSNDGKAKLIGFGNAMLRELAMYYRDGHDFSTLSLRWTAPEVLGGYSSKSREIDVYALGMTMLEIITGKLPFDETKSDQEVLIKIMSRTIPSRPQELAANDSIWTLLTRCWDANPSTRPSARDVCAILEPLAK